MINKIVIEFKGKESLVEIRWDSGEMIRARIKEGELYDDLFAMSSETFEDALKEMNSDEDIEVLEIHQ